MKVSCAMGFGVPCESVFTEEAPSIKRAESTIQTFFEEANRLGHYPDAWGQVYVNDEPIYIYSLGPRGGFVKEKA